MRRAHFHCVPAGSNVTGRKWGCEWGKETTNAFGLNEVTGIGKEALRAATGTVYFHYLSLRTGLWENKTMEGASLWMVPKALCQVFVELVDVIHLLLSVFVLDFED